MEFGLVGISLSVPDKSSGPVIVKLNGAQALTIVPDLEVECFTLPIRVGVNRIEREGISFSHPARFALVGTMNPEEGDLRAQLLDRFGLCVEVVGIRAAIHLSPRKLSP